MKRRIGSLLLLCLLCACLCTQALGGGMSAGMHGSTFGGNPVACAAGRYMLSRLTQPAFLEEVARKGAAIRQRLAAMGAEIFRKHSES